MTEVEQELRYFTIAIELALRGARPHVICALTQMRHDRVADIYENINGERPKKGRTPQQLDAFLRSKHISLAATFFIIKFLRALKLSIGQANSIILAYDSTADRFNDDGKPLISFDRAWNIVQTVTYQQSHHLTKCRTCSSKYLQHRNQLKNDAKFCPICALMKNQILEDNSDDFSQSSLPFHTTQ